MRTNKKILFVLLGIMLCAAALTPSEALAEKTFLAAKDYVQLPEEKIDIAEGSLIIAKDIYPDLDIQEYINKIDAMAEDLKPKLKGVRQPEQIIKIISNHILIKKNIKYKNDAFFLSDVLDKGYGNCNCLVTLYLSVTERLKSAFLWCSRPRTCFCEI